MSTPSGEAGSSAPSPAAPGAYRERLSPAPWVWAAALVLAIGVGLSFTRLDGTVGLVAFAVAAVAVGWFLVRTTPVVAVEEGHLVAGRARVPVAVTGPAQVLDADTMRHETGPGLDARAYLCMRGWIPTGVRIPLVVPADPSPYWLVSSRRPAELAAAVEAARPSAG